MRKKYQRKERKSNHKFKVVGGQELLVRVPLPLTEVWAEMQIANQLGFMGGEVVSAVASLRC